MDRRKLLEEVHSLRAEGKSIRAIASELGVHPSRVQRVLRSQDQGVVPIRQRGSLPSQNQGIFVGRQRELAQLTGALGDTFTGRGYLVMLGGEPGIGKTRTVQELAGVAQQHRIPVFWGRCYEEPGARPYWPWVQVIRSYVQEHHPDQLRSVMGIGAGDIAQIVAEVKEALPDVEPPPGLEPEQARFRLFDSVTTFLKNISRRLPSLLVLDNLQWADRPSLLLLEFLAQELVESRLLVVGTYRDGELSRQHSLSQTLGELTKHPYLQRISLKGLDPEDIHDLIEVTAGVRPPQSLTEAVHQQTQGNPLFITEVVKMLVQEGRLTEEVAESHSALSWRIPEGVREAIGRRLHRLSEGCNQVMTVASVVGREFGFGLLKRLLADFSAEQLLETLEEWLAAGIIEELVGQAGRYRFTHVLIQNTLAGELSSARRGQWHAEIGKTLEELYGTKVEVHAAELAYHFAEAMPVVGSHKMVHYSRLAGEQALAAHAHEEALEHFQRALDIKEDQVMDAETASLLAGLGRAQAATFERQRISEVMETLGRALTYFAEVGDIEHAVAIAEYPFYPLLSQRTGNADLIAVARALVPFESPEAGRLLSRYGRVMGVEEGNYIVAQQAFHQALSIARRNGDLLLEFQTLAASANVDMLYAHPNDSLAKSQRAIALARTVDDPEAEALARYSLGLDHLILGSLDGMRLQAPAVLATAERLRDRFWLTLAFRSYEDIAHLQGDWQAAFSYSDRGLQLLPLECRNLCTRTVLEYQTGNFIQGAMYLQRLIAVMHDIPPGPTLEHALTAMVIPLAARISGEGNLLSAGEAAANTVISFEPRITYMDRDAQIGLALLAELRQDIDLAKRQYTLLASFEGSMMPFVMVSTDRIKGILAKTIGNLDQAIQHFGEGLDFCRKANYLPELAWTCCGCADALVQRNLPGDRGRGRALLEECLTISNDLGMPPLIQRSQVRHSSMDASMVMSKSYPNGLSEREVEVLRLITLGKTNRDIAEDLFISLNTVANHVRNILTKTNASNRAEAAAFATRHNLVVCHS
jgi:DNA-binding CsgD family transcriptional regulator/tetratricopeptide (TPR) repeat protein